MSENPTVRKPMIEVPRLGFTSAIRKTAKNPRNAQQTSGWEQHDAEPLEKVPAIPVFKWAEDSDTESATPTDKPVETRDELEFSSFVDFNKPEVHRDRVQLNTKAKQDEARANHLYALTVLGQDTAIPNWHQEIHNEVQAEILLYKLEDWRRGGLPETDGKLSKIWHAGVTKRHRQIMREDFDSDWR